MGDDKKFDDQKESRDNKEDCRAPKKENHDKDESKCSKKEDHHQNSKKDCKCSKKEHRNHCQSCICLLLKKAGPGKLVRVVTDSGDIIEGKFLGFSEETCCALIEVNEIVSPPIPCEVVFVDCLKIESVVFIN
ncbi:hypothetical protein E4665_07650 [Sporolactobacillus shoreae]|uniref:Uncharacterized protein n=1 Tax=Sporolactobacillus shoreae TaxID=1465501 RepID=A0A4Z0GNK8_9BACL|nr:hypothetical protein [Sporolactobacillus shoreae]TGA98720.1 hypothetical protein E4665_07650 [Sporolactobacillus shoreae]